MPRLSKAAKAEQAAMAHAAHLGHPPAQVHAGAAGAHPAAAAFAPPAMPPAASAAAAPVPMGRVVDVDNFKKVRDSAVERLQMISALMQNFCTDYVHQTNLLIGLESEHDNPAIANGMLPANFMPMMPMMPMMHTLPHPEEKKERKKRVHDPNAPKRPLTPYFLYMQTARPIIAIDLGPGTAKGAVQDEGQRRWSVMTADEKEGWNRAYAYNLRLYQARSHAYKNGNPDARNMTDEEARIYAETNKIETPNAPHLDDPAPHEQAAIAHQLQQLDPEEPATRASTEEEPHNDEQEEEEEAEEEDPVPDVPEPPVKTPRAAKGGRKRKGAEPADESIATATAPEPTPEVKKRKRTSKALEADEVKKSSRKKKNA